MSNDLAIYDILKRIENRANPVIVDAKNISMELVKVNDKYVLKKDAKIYRGIIEFLNAKIFSEKEAKFDKLVNILQEERMTATDAELIELIEIYNAASDFIKALRTGNVNENKANKQETKKSPINTEAKINEKAAKAGIDLLSFLAVIQTLNPNVQIILDPVNKKDLICNVLPYKLKLPKDFYYSEKNSSIEKLTSSYDDFVSIKLKTTVNTSTKQSPKSSNNNLITIKNPFNISEVVTVLQKLNPNVSLFIDPISKVKICSNGDPHFLVYPEGFYYNDKNGITNKHNSRLYVEYYVQPFINKTYEPGEFDYLRSQQPSAAKAKQPIKETKPKTPSSKKVFDRKIYEWKSEIDKKTTSLKGNTVAGSTTKPSPMFNNLLNEFDDILKFTIANGAEAGTEELNKFLIKINKIRPDLLTSEEKNKIIDMVSKYKLSLIKNTKNTKL